MQQTLPFDPISDGAPAYPGTHAPAHLGTQAPVFVRHPRARRYVVRVRTDGSVRVTIPRGGSKRDAVAFAEQQRAWIEKQLARLEIVRAAPREQLSEEDRKAFLRVCTGSAFLRQNS